MTTSTSPSPSPPRPGSSASSQTFPASSKPSSSTTTSSSVSPSSSGPPVIVTPGPTDILPSRRAQTYANIHPALLLSLYAARFPSLVADPVNALLSQLPLLAVLQVAYVVTCLPPVGSAPSSGESSAGGAEGGEKRTVSSSSSGSGTSSTTSSTTAPAPSSVIKAGKVGYRRRHHHHHHHHASSRLWGKLTPALLSLTLTFLLGTPVFAILLVLFGAPFTTHHPHTLLCAAHMALLSAAPLIYVHGVDGHVWREIWAVNRPADPVWGGALGCGVGAWFGAIPIPLDWDRPWQAFPITIITGAYIGYAVGSLICRTPLLYGKRIQFEPPEEQDGEAEQREKSS
ncbi:phosphoethanolamine transferase [Thermoascus aurantiacus ATCC 26904]